MVIEKGRAWGEPGPLPADGIVVASDAEARAVIEEARRAGRSVPVLGLLGGDLCHTLGGRGDAGRLRSDQANTYPVDLGAVLADGHLHWFVSHLVARSRLWRRAFVAMNAQWYWTWNLGPRAHPGDGLLDTYDARLRARDVWPVRTRLAHGTHLPHPAIRERRVSAIQVTLERALPLELDGVAVGTARVLSIRIEPDALLVVV
jgi:YegS C-terminal NAD kinase beta sandwich-like domain